ncbi:MAG: hypothetical protein AAF631_00735 [Pseudomonadota bacterium]
MSPMAWALMSIRDRTANTGMVGPVGEINFPYRQGNMAHAIGPSLVYTNKTPAKLWQRQMVTWANEMLIFHAIEGLKRLADVTGSDAKRRPLV